MSLTLRDGIEVKTNSDILELFYGNRIRIGDHYILLEDFCEVVKYFFENTDLENNDCRIGLKKHISNLYMVDGYNKGKTRFARVDGL